MIVNFLRQLIAFTLAFAVSVGLFLLMPPLLGLFDESRYLFDIPLLLVYLFAVWLIGILLTALVARRLLRESGE